jgi:hypothetical protein
MARNRVQIALGLLLAIGIWFSMNQLTPDKGESLTLALTKMSLLAIVAFGIGGFVARANFILPSMCLALVVWLVVTAYSLSIALELGNPMWSQFIWNLPTLVLIPAVAVGALGGTAMARWVQSESSAEKP